MAKHIVTCRFCKKKFDTNTTDYIMPKERFYYHTECYKEEQDSKTKEEKDVEEFYNCMKEIFGEYNYVVTKKLANKYISENGYTYSGMTKALRWYYQIQNNPIEKANGTIGLLPYFYNDAKNYYHKIYLAELANKEKNLKEYIPKEKVIEIMNPQIYIKPLKLFFSEEDNE